MEYLQSAKQQEVVDVLKHCQDQRGLNRQASNGYSKDRTMRKLMSFHPSVVFHPEWSKYFDKEMDPHERKKNMYAFARKHPEYLVVDKL